MENGNAEIVKLLIARGANVNLRREERVTSQSNPLWEATRRGHVEVAEALIVAGADVNAKKSSGWTLLHEALAMRSDYVREEAVPMEEPEWSSPAGDWDRYNALLDSVVESRIVPMVRLLADRGVEVNAGDDQRLTPLHSAAYRGHTVVVELLIAKGADVNVGTVPDPTPDSIVWESNWECRLGPGVTPLHEAAAGGEPNVAAVLLAHGARVNTVDESGKTPLHYAAARANHRVAELLIDGGTDVNVLDKSGTTPLVLSLIQGDVATAKRLIAAGAGKVSLRDYCAKKNLDGPPLLHRAVGGAGVTRTVRRGEGIVGVVVDQSRALRREWVELLLDNDADPNERGENGDTALHAAIAAGDEVSARWIIAHGVDIRAGNYVNRTALHSAASDGMAGLVSAAPGKGGGRQRPGQRRRHASAQRRPARPQRCSRTAPGSRGGPEDSEQPQPHAAR